MPVFRSADHFPGWCELEHFDLISLADGESVSLARTGGKEEIIVCGGSVVVESVSPESRLAEGQKMDLDSADAPGFVLRASDGPALVFHAAGRWDSITSSGIFWVSPGDPPAFDTPHDYVKSTTFDNHYHDCDEYWVFFQGRCRAVSEGKFYDVGRGDCVATGMGWHHDVQFVLGDELVKAVWFEGTIEGQKRIGHLWEPAHGKAEPKADRV